jgi:hypothetical protein
VLTYKKEKVMKVYIITEGWAVDFVPEGHAFSTKEKAEKYINKLLLLKEESAMYEIEEIELDKED